MIASITIKLKVQRWFAWISCDLTIILLLICLLHYNFKYNWTFEVLHFDFKQFSIDFFDSIFHQLHSFNTCVSLLTLPVIKEEKQLRFSSLIILTRITWYNTTLGKYLCKLHNHIHGGIHNLCTHVQAQVIHVHEIGWMHEMYANLYWHT